MKTIQETYSEIIQDQKVLQELEIRVDKGDGNGFKKANIFERQAARMIMMFNVSWKKHVVHLEERIKKIEAEAAILKKDGKLKEATEKLKIASGIKNFIAKVRKEVIKGKLIYFGSIILMFGATVALTYYILNKYFKESKAKTEEEKKKAEETINKEAQDGVNEAKRLVSKMPKDKQEMYLKRINSVQAKIK